jgi:integrase
MNLELRGRIYYATLLVPEDVRSTLGKTRFKQSLGTGNKREAELLKAPYIASWKAQIKQARGSTNAVSNEALRWKNALAQAPDEDTRHTWEIVLADEVERIEEAEGFQAAKDFHDLAAGLTTPSSLYYDTWKTQITLAPKTKDQMIKDVGLLVAKFPTLQGITKNSVRRWIDQLRASGKGASSISRILSFCRHYWKYVQTYDAVDEESAPFTGVLESAPKKNKKRKTANYPYTPADVVKLWQAAATRRVGQAGSKATDTQLADLIALGAFSGARIEELCSLKTSKVFEDYFSIEDAKTEAGWREVPIHSAIAPLVKRLKKASKDGYLLSGLTFNKYEDRSNAIGKRYGRLKKAQGFPDTHTFHSYRSTVSTLLENAKVPEGIAADIIGHDKPSMTYGLYSGGSYMDTMREALEKVCYPFPTALE